MYLTVVVLQALSGPDLVLTQKFILRNTSFTAEQRSAADMDGDGIVNSFDLVLMRMALIGE